MYIRRKVFSLLEDVYGEERYFSTTEVVMEGVDYMDEERYFTSVDADDKGYIRNADGSYRLDANGRKIKLQGLEDLEDVELKEGQKFNITGKSKSSTYGTHEGQEMAKLGEVDNRGVYRQELKKGETPYTKVKKSRMTNKNYQKLIEDDKKAFAEGRIGNAELIRAKSDIRKLQEQLKNSEASMQKLQKQLKKNKKIGTAAVGGTALLGTGAAVLTSRHRKND